MDESRNLWTMFLSRQFRLNLFFLSLFSIFSIAIGQNASDRIIFDTPLPKLFKSGEIFYLKGHILDAAPNAQVSIFGTMSTNNYTIDKTAIAKNGSFTLPIHFKYEGAYLLQFYLNSEEIFSQSVFATERENIKSKTLSTISNIQIIPYKGHYRVVWNSDNELIHLKFEQGDNKLDFFLSNHPTYFRLTSRTFDSFIADTIFVSLRGARSQNGSLYQQCSDWGQWEKTFFVPMLKYIAKKSTLIRFKTTLNETGNPGQPLVIDFYSRDYFIPEAYIKRPDGFVDVIPIKTSKKPTIYKIADVRISMAGECSASLTYNPDSKGIYLIEINNRNGLALINIPYYVGENCIPIISQSSTNNDGWEEASCEKLEQKIFARINHLRSKLGIQKLEPDSTLFELGRYYANKMAKNSFCGHFAPDDETVVTRKKRFHIVTHMQENVAMATNPWLAQKNLENSPGHYLAMIDSSCELAGVGVAKNESGSYYIAQYFAPKPMTKDQKGKFLAGLFKKMREKRKNVKSIPKKKRSLKRIYQKGSWPAIKKLKILASSLERIEEMILVEEANTTWKLESVREVLFENFEETVDGIRLTISFFPPNLQKKNNNSKKN